MLYKPKSEQTVSFDVVITKSTIELDFHSDCGKYGTDEMLAVYKLSAERLLQILNDREDITDDESN